MIKIIQCEQYGVKNIEKRNLFVLGLGFWAKWP